MHETGATRDQLANVALAVRRIREAGGEVTKTAHDDSFLQAWLPLDRLDSIAALPEVDSATTRAAETFLAGCTPTERARVRTAPPSTRRLR